ncbi:hypothetical protein ACFXCZ_05530 [Streptomyces sp. NPDC059396]|uniref:hypothetical protein n=1 Tax=Streptomyces sp. NPDC059396 TaxID=3346819 RepID=UPI00367C8163
MHRVSAATASVTATGRTDRFAAGVSNGPALVIGREADIEVAVELRLDTAGAV